MDSVLFILNSYQKKIVALSGFLLVLGNGKTQSTFQTQNQGKKYYARKKIIFFLKKLRSKTFLTS